LIIMSRNFGHLVATSRLIGALAVGALTLASYSAQAQDANHFVLHVVNDGADLYVNLLDQHAGSASILQNARVNHGDRKDVLVTKDGNGKASVSWTAKTASSDKPQCGSGSKSGIDVGAELAVSANKSC
jgi:hypothetical protein